MQTGDTPSEEPEHRQHERAQQVGQILEATEAATAERAYPASSDELVAEHRATEFDLANETETLEDAFDRLADEFASPAEAREALTAEITRDERFDDAFTDEPTQQ